MKNTKSITQIIMNPKSPAGMHTLRGVLPTEMNKNQHIQTRIKVLGPLASKERGGRELTLEREWEGGKWQEVRWGIPPHPYLID